MEQDEGYFGAPVAATYDRDSADMFDPAVAEPAVDRLAALAGGGRALEFAVGTGRVALPLAERGVRVAGIDSSRAMLARLSGKPGAERIEAVAGDMAATRVDGDFSLVYLVFNTIFNLTTQDGQVACFENAAAHLGSGGRFVIEARVPEPQRGRRLPAESDRAALRLARRARPDGAPGGDAARATLGWMGRRAVHGTQPLARVGLPEALSERGIARRFAGRCARP